MKIFFYIINIFDFFQNLLRKKLIMRTNNFNFKKFFLDLIKKINFNILNLNTHRTVTIIWAITWIISLFLAWIIDEKAPEKWNSFQDLSGNVWYINILLLLIIIFITFGENYKEKMKLYTEINFKNYVFIIFSWAFMILSSFIILRFSVWLERFWSEIKHWSWIILSVVSSILILSGWYLTRKDFHKNSSEIILERLSKERSKEKEKKQIHFDF